MTSTLLSCNIADGNLVLTGVVDNGGEDNGGGDNGGEETQGKSVPDCDAYTFIVNC